MPELAGIWHNLGTCIFGRPMAVGESLPEWGELFEVTIIQFIFWKGRSMLPTYDLANPDHKHETPNVYPGGRHKPEELETEWSALNPYGPGSFERSN